MEVKPVRKDLRLDPNSFHNKNLEYLHGSNVT